MPPLFKKMTELTRDAAAGMAPEQIDDADPNCDVLDQCNACQTDRFYSELAFDVFYICCCPRHPCHVDAPLFLVKIWLFNTPEVNAVTIFLSAPVALAVSLWGMTSSKIRQALAHGSR